MIVRMQERVRKSSTLIVCSTPNGRGIHRYALGLKEQIPGAEILVPRMKSLLVAWEIVGILAMWIKISRYGQVIFANSRVSPFVWPLLRRTRTVVVVHDLMDTTEELNYNSASDTWVSRLKRSINTWIIKGSIERAWTVILNSYATKKQIDRLGWVSSANIYILNPVPSFKEYRPVLESDRLISKRAQKNRICLLSVTGKTKNKCLGDYFNMVEKLVKSEGIDISMVLVGVEEVELEKRLAIIYAENRDRITLKKGIRGKELLALYMDSDVFVSLSVDEGYGIPLADAAGFGIPVIARDIPAFSEIANMGGLKGLVELCKDVDEVVELIAKKRDKYCHNEEDRNMVIARRVENYARYRQECRIRAEPALRDLISGWDGR